MLTLILAILEELDTVCIYMCEMRGRSSPGCEIAWQGRLLGARPYIWQN